MTIGVYAVMNMELGEISYIGCSLNIEKRWKHVLRKLKANTYGGELQKSYDKLGVEIVEWKILEETQPEDRWDRENFWIDYIGPERGRKGRPDQWKAANLAWEDPLRREMAIQSLSMATKGKIRSPEIREKLSLAMRGRAGVWEGKKRSEESKERMRISHIGKPMSSAAREKMKQAQLARWERIKLLDEVPEQEKARREKIKNALTGKPRPPEVVAKFSASLKGREVWNKGIPCSEETKENIRKGQLRRRQLKNQESAQ